MVRLNYAWITALVTSCLRWYHFQTVETKHNKDSTAILYSVLFSGRLQDPAGLYVMCCVVMVFSSGYFNNNPISSNSNIQSDSTEYVSD